MRYRRYRSTGVAATYINRAGTLRTSCCSTQPFVAEKRTWTPTPVIHMEEYRTINWDNHIFLPVHTALSHCLEIVERSVHCKWMKAEAKTMSIHSSKQFTLRTVSLIGFLVETTLSFHPNRAPGWPNIFGSRDTAEDVEGSEQR